MNIIETIEKEQFKKDIQSFRVGDSVKVHTRVLEGDKERIQIFAGIVIGRKGRGLNESFTVRRVAYGEGVERVFPIHSPRLAKIQVERKGDIRRAKLYYLRDRKGKAATTVREKSERRNAAATEIEPTAAATETAAPEATTAS
ncbi:MAG: 50S ribosomal protein L19 [Chthoniobacterales bacterium]